MEWTPEQKWFACGGTGALANGREPGLLMELHQFKLGYHYFTMILQSSVGTLEAHSEAGVYLASFCVPN